MIAIDSVSAAGGFVPEPSGGLFLSDQDASVRSARSIERHKTILKKFLFIIVLLHIDRRIVSKVAHRAYNLFVITFFEEQALGKIHAHFVARQSQSNRTASGGAILEIGAISAFFIELGKLTNRGTDLREILAHLK